MEKYTIEKDICVAFVTAKSFPDGVMAAHHALHSKIPMGNNRKFYGISFPDKAGTIIYKAAAELFTEQEQKETGLDTFMIRKGEYASITIKNFMNDVTSIGKAFTQLLSHPQLDLKGACIEWYINDTDVICMVRLEYEQ